MSAPDNYRATGDKAERERAADRRYWTVGAADRPAAQAEWVTAAADLLRSVRERREQELGR